MSRSGYSEDYCDDDPLAQGRWQAQIANALRGKRGQKFLLDLVVALDALPAKRLVTGVLEKADGEVCALGALKRFRAVDVQIGADDPSRYEDEGWEDSDWDALAKAFNIAPQLAQETMYQNDEVADRQTPEQRWERMRAWAMSNLLPETLIREEVAGV